jgi:hypothetical protein
MMYEFLVCFMRTVCPVYLFYFITLIIFGEEYEASYYVIFWTFLDNNFTFTKER